MAKIRILEASRLVDAGGNVGQAPVINRVTTFDIPASGSQVAVTLQAGTRFVAFDAEADCFVKMGDASGTPTANNTDSIPVRGGMLAGWMGPSPFGAKVAVTPWT